VLGCVEDFDLKLKEAEPRLVVEGMITNQTVPYYVRLTKSTPGGLTSIDNSFNQTDNAEPVEDASVVITDDKGQCDTLKYTIIDVYGEEYDESFYNQGFYATKKIKGIPGRTYYLEINWNNQKYTSSSYMQDVPVIENLGYKNVYSETKKESHYVPTITFNDPKDVVNYYLIQTCDINYSKFWSTSTLWQFSIIEDSHLKPEVIDLEISNGATPRGIDFYPVYMEGDNIYIALSSISKDAYSYYKVLLQQFENDGGAYKPTPATPPGNINNGALGLFQASAVSEKTITIPRSSNK
jgi:hypothetical protein